MNERLTQLTRADVQRTMQRVEPQASYSALISSELQETVFGQPQAADAVARRLALFDTGLSDPKRPLGVMMFLGPSGVGKTEMAHAASKQMFGDTHSERLKIINMSEFSEPHTISRLVGSPPGYVDHQNKSKIDHAWLHKGRSIIVLDEIEKAHPKVLQLFLGAFDKGALDARNGSAGEQALSFTNTLFILTSNIGGREIHSITEGTAGIGFKTNTPTVEDNQTRIQSVVDKGLKEALSPEFINRIDDVVVFQEIRDRELHTKIFDKFVDYRNQDMKNSSQADAPYFAVTQEFKDHVLDIVGDKGGREMKRELERKLFNKAADVFMGIDVKGKPLVADIDPDTGETVFYTSDIETIPSEKKSSETEQRDRPIPRDPRPESGDTNSDGTSEPPTDSGEKTQSAGETPPSEGGSEEPPPEEPKSNSIPEPYHGDSGDEIDSDNRPFNGDIIDLEPGKPARIGFRIIAWNEDSVSDEGDAHAVIFEHRDIPLP